MNVHIIFLNDYAELVVLGSLEYAENIKEELAKEYWKKNKLNIIQNSLGYDQTCSDEELYIHYRKSYLWYIDTVKMIKEKINNKE